MGTQLKRVLFAGGGTGGHVYMAIAIAKELEKRNRSAELLFVGTEEGLESRIVPHHGYALSKIQIGGLKNVGGRKVLSTCLQIPKSLVQSTRILRKFKPELGVGLGGYSSGPVIGIATLLRIPTLLIEPNVFPGFANRILARWVSGAAVAFEETAKYFGKKAKLTGVPIRKEFFRCRSSAPGEKLNVLIFGGSRGSSPINKLLVEALPDLEKERIRVVHQTGPSDLVRVRQAYAREGVESEVIEYIDNMPPYFEKSDLVVSRAGASTIAELAAAGKPAILIPFPQAADDHQTKNAQALARRKAAVLLHQAETKGSDLARLINELNRERSRLTEMRKQAHGRAESRATQSIVDFMEELVS